MKLIDKDTLAAKLERKPKNIKLPKKYETCDWMFIYNHVGLTDEHIKRLNNAINILKSVNEHTDAKYLKEIKDKLLEVNEMKEVDLEKYYHDFLQKEWFDKNCNRTISEMMIFTAKHFFELGLKAQKEE